MTNAANRPAVKSAVGASCETFEMLNCEGVERVRGIRLEAAKSAHARVAEMQKAVGSMQPAGEAQHKV